MQHKFKLLAAIAAFIILSFCAKAQSIRVFNSCYAPSKTFVFFEADAYSAPIQYHTIESWCPKVEMPKYKLETGNYEFRNLPVSEGETWNWFIEKNGKMTKKGDITGGYLKVELGETERLTILIVPTQDPDKPVAVDGF